MAMPRGFRPPMPVGKLKSPLAFSQQERQPEPTLRGAAAPAGVARFGLNKTAVAAPASSTAPAPASTPTAQTPAATTPPAPDASPAAPAAGKINLNKFQPASPQTAPTPRAPAPASTPTVQTPAATTPPAPDASPAAPAAGKINLNKFQPASPQTAPTPRAPAPSSAAAPAVAIQPAVAKPPAEPVLPAAPAPATTSTTSPTKPVAPDTKPKSPVNVPSAEVVVPASAPKAASAPTAAPAPQPAAAPPSSTKPVAEVSQPRAPPVVELDPAAELVFRGVFSEGVTTRLRLTNKSPDSRVCFKVKTNAPPFYSVHPSIDIIEPLQDFDVTVYLQATSGERPDFDGPHKFMVQSIFAPDGQIASLEKLWQQARPTEIASAKLNCAFEKTQQVLKIERKLSVPNGVDTFQAKTASSTKSKPQKSTKTESSSSGFMVVVIFAAAAAMVAAMVYQFVKQA